MWRRVVRDPSESMRQAYNLGIRLLDGTATDYRMDSVRSAVIRPAAVDTFHA